MLTPSEVVIVGIFQFLAAPISLFPAVRLGLSLERSKDVYPMIPAIARHIAFFIYPRFNLLDLSGPLDAFAVATDMAPDNYRFTVMSLEGGEIESWAGAKVTSEVAVPDGIDTLVIVGDAGMADREVSSDTVDFIRTAAAGA